MAKLRNIQFLRNNTIAEPFISYGAARTAAEVAFAGISDFKDGEIALYSYKLTTTGETVHTLFGIKRDGGIEILGNYDELTAEYQSYVTVAIEGLDGSATIASVSEGVVTLKTGIVQTNGVVDNITDDEGITLAKVATTGAAADVSVTAIEGLTATNVQVALAELQDDIDAINDHTITAVANQAVVVTTGEDGNTTIGLVLADGEKVLSQTADGLKTNLDLRYDSTTKKIQLLGKTTGEGETATAEIVGEINATDFIKDGMLADATIVSGTWADGEFTESETGKDKAIKFVWKTYQQGQSGQEEVLKTEYLNVESLVDAYISGNDWIEIDGTNNTISHKTQNAFSVQGETTPQTTFGANAADVTADAATESVEFKVPSFTVDAAGHITTASEKTVTVTLPAAQTITGETAIEGGSDFVSTAVTATKGQDNDNYTLTSTSTVKTQTMAGIAVEGAEDGLATASDVKTYVDTKVGSAYTVDGELEMSDERVITHKTKTGLPTEAKGSVSVNTINVPVITVNEYGHVTALTDSSYTVKYPTVSGTTGQIIVDTTAATDTDGVKYTVSLAKVVEGNATNVTPEEAEDDYAVAGTEEAPLNKHTRVENITVDAYGRVTAYTLTTVTENFDAGTY